MAPKVSFDERIDQLIKFEAVNGHLFVPRSEPGIGKWCDNTRTFKSKLKAEQMAKLDEIGFPWKVPKGPEKAVMIEWGKKFKLLVTFHKMKGHCNVPATLGGKPYPLAGWCDEQRQQLGEEKLERDKFEKLSRLGFDFFGDSSVDSTGGEGEEPATKRQRTEKESDIEVLRKDIAEMQETIKALADRMKKVEDTS